MSTPDQAGTPPVDLDDESARELRVALVLYGGVSLAIYIYGVVLEFWRLVRASRGLDENPYRALLENAQASATVDIVSGASAGGINGVLLAKALANGSDLASCRSLWVERGDFIRMMRSTSEQGPRSLLRSSYFDEQLLEGFAAMDRPPNKQGLVTALDLFVPGTRLRGWVRSYVDDFGQVVGSRQYRKIFHLRYRSRGYNPKAPQQGYSQNDFTTESNELLAEVSRATSAFPFAFEPKLIERRENDPRFSADEPKAEYFADGGILHNRPFTEAISTIAARASGKPVDRWLASVEPDPEHFLTEQPPGPEPEVVEVVSKALSGIPRYESIAADLDRLNEYRQRVDSRREFLRTLDATIDATPTERLDTLAALADEAGTPISSLPTRQAAELLREKAVNDDLVGRLLAAGRLDASFRPAVEAAVAQLTVPDYAFERRRLSYLIEKIDRSLPGPPITPPDAARDALLDLWAHYEEIEQALWDATGFDSPVGTRLAESRQGTWDDVSRAISETVPASLDALSNQITQTRTATALDVFNADVTLVPELDYAPSLQRTFEEFEIWDTFLVSVDALAERPEREKVSFVRISPLAATYVRKPLEEKLAGDALGHFGGFIERRWRDNDILWGRLDAAEVIVRILHRQATGASSEAALEEAIRSVQEPIARSEIQALRERPNADYRLYLEREYTVGGETLANIPIATRANLVEQGATVFRNMLGGLAERSSGGGIDAGLRTIYRWIGRALGLGLGLTRWPVRAIWGKDVFLRRLATLVLLAGVIWATVTIALVVLQIITDPSQQLWTLIGLAYAAFLVYVSLLAFVDRPWRRLLPPPTRPPPPSASPLPVGRERATAGIVAERASVWSDVVALGQGDTPSLTFELREEPTQPRRRRGLPGRPLDLTGAEVELRLRRPSGAVVSKDCDIADVAGGVIRCALDATDSATTGTLRFEVVVTVGTQTRTIPSDGLAELVVVETLESP